MDKQNMSTIIDFREYLENSIKLDKRRLTLYRRIYRRNPDGKLIRRLSKNKKKYEYTVKLPGDEKYRYAGRDKRKLVLGIQNRHLAESMINVLENNIYWKQKLLDNLMNANPYKVLSNLPKAYQTDNELAGTVDDSRRNRKVQQSESDYKREELKIETKFGLFVRTKGEALIAELLYDLGIEFRYEKALVLNVTRYDEVGVPYSARKTYYPDFTIVLPDDRLVYWEHMGMLSKMSYVVRNNQKTVDYNQNQIFVPHNMMISAEGPNNEIDMEGILRIISGWLMPLLAV